MKQYMKIIGMKIVYVSPAENDGVVELTLAPLDMVKPKNKSIMEMALRNVMDIVEEVGSSQRFETKIYIPWKTWVEEFKNQPLSNVWVDVSIETFADDIVKNVIKEIKK